MYRWTIAAIMLILFALVFANPHIDVSMIGTTQIPYDYDYVVQENNGNLQFYRVEYSDSTAHFYNFSFDASNNSLSSEISIGVATGLSGLSNYYTEMDWSIRYGKLYLMHKISTGLVCFVLAQNSLTTHHINNVSFPQFSFIEPRVELVNENALVIAEEYALLYFDLQTSNSQTLISGPEYQCIFGQYPIVIYLKDDYFIYAKDSQMGGGNVPEVWYLFASDGTLLSTMSSIDTFLTNSMLYQNKGVDVPKIQGRWYLSNTQIVMTDEKLECSIDDENSIHLFSFAGPGNPIDETCVGLYPFGNDRILRHYYDDSFPSHDLYINNVPLEENETPLITYISGDSFSVSVISQDIDAIFRFADNNIDFQIAWTGNGLNLLPFSFPAAIGFSTIYKTFVDQSNLRIVMEDGIYSFNIVETTPIIDDEATPVNEVISAFPNPFKESTTIKFKTKTPLLNLIIEVYNIKGQRIKFLEILKSDSQENSITWDGTDDIGKSVSSGVYFCRLTTSEKVKTYKMIKLK